MDNLRTTRRTIILTAIILLLFTTVVFLDSYLTSHFVVLNQDLSVDLMSVSLVIWIVSFSLLDCDLGLIIHLLLKQGKSRTLLACLIVALVAIFFFVPVIHLGTSSRSSTGMDFALRPWNLRMHNLRMLYRRIVVLNFISDIRDRRIHYCAVSVFFLVFCYVIPPTIRIVSKQDLSNCAEKEFQISSSLISSGC